MRSALLVCERAALLKHLPRRFPNIQCDRCEGGLFEARALS